jgi:glycosyltransferase involved in cell wall biosynthesis
MSGSAETVRVLLVGPSLRKLGGQAIQARRLLEAFGTVPGLEVSFVPIDPPLPGLLGRLQQVRWVRTVVTEIAYLASLLRRIPRVDVVHVFSASYFSFLLAPAPAILLARLMGKKVVVNYRSGEAADHLARWGWHVRPLLRLAHAIVTPSEYLVGVFAGHGLRAESVENFVDLDRIPFRIRDQPAPRFLANRNFESLYNVACVVRAFALVQKEIPAATLTLAGTGSRRAELDGLVDELGLRGVRFAGAVPPEEMARLYGEADLYLNAPDIDNMPNSIIEAFAAGLPVVSTAAGGIPFIVTDGLDGLLVPVGDSAALAAAALRVLREPGLAARLTGAARARAATTYSWDAVRTRWLALYRRLATGTG